MLDALALSCSACYSDACLAVVGRREVFFQDARTLDAPASDVAVDILEFDGPSNASDCSHNVVCKPEGCLRESDNLQKRDCICDEKPETMILI